MAPAMICSFASGAAVACTGNWANRSWSFRCGRGEHPSQGCHSHGARRPSGGCVRLKSELTNFIES